LRPVTASLLLLLLLLLPAELCRDLLLTTLVRLAVCPAPR